jgi:threonine dehydrogenase-like Zn-dependent dehydrogenase
MGEATMRAAVWDEGGALRLAELSRPEPGPGELRVRVRACGICGSDLHLRAAGLVARGVAPGHEFAGTVDSVGAGVGGPRRGDPVAVEPLRSCGRCDACRRGLDAICVEGKLLGVHEHGGFAEFAVVEAARAFPVPADLDLRVAALAEPAAVVLRGLRRARLQKGDRLLVLGAGPIGLLGALAARALGAGEVWISARYAAQAELARRLGATRVLDEAEAAPAGVPRERFDAVLETVGGRSDTLASAAAAVRRGGTVAVLGVFFGPLQIEAMPLLLKEVTLAWSYCYGRDAEPCEFAAAIRLLAEERERAALLLTHALPLAGADRAFELAADRRGGAAKVTVIP